MRYKLIVLLILLFQSNRLFSQQENYDSISTIVYKNAYELIDQYE